MTHSKHTPLFWLTAGILCSILIIVLMSYVIDRTIITGESCSVRRI